MNPVAVELAEVSLWLNALSKDRFVPWFGLQLHCGNSLIGARRETYTASQLTTDNSKDTQSWHNNAPVAVAMADPLPDNCIWHFLLPDRGMASYKDKTAKTLYKTEISAIDQWRKDFCKKFSTEDIKRLTALSQTIDALWQEIGAAGELCYAIETFAYGMREFALYDNCGYLLKFGMPIE